jgi:hypothetical protein
MDPDMVRQQEEAEREALMLMARQKFVPSPGAAGTGNPAAAPLYFETMPAGRLQPEPAGPATGTAAGPALALRDGLRQDRPLAVPARTAVWGKVFERLGRFVSFGVAGAMLGGGLGIAAVNYFELPSDAAKVAVFGPAASMALLCALLSLLAGGSKPERRSR